MNIATFASATMKKIGLLSDTHGWLPSGIFRFFQAVDEIWHAGDIGNIQVVKQLRQIAYLRAVYGNIDGQDLRRIFPEYLIFNCEEIKIGMIHIGGYPNKYTHTAKKLIQTEHPKLFITGHSHILKVMFDKKNNLLHINPGSAGKSGFHKKITLLRFIIDGTNMQDLEILEIDRKQKNK